MWYSQLVSFSEIRSQSTLLHLTQHAQIHLFGVLE
jgi:hypothetical protein